MKRVPAIAAASLMAAGLAACSGTSTPTSEATLSASSTAATPVSRSAPPSSHATTTAVAAKATTSLDPCKLVTREEASAMAHASFGPGLEQGPSTGRRCVYGAQTKNVLTVVVAAASSADEAQAHWNQLLAQAQSAFAQAEKASGGEFSGLGKLTPQPGIGDRAEWVELDLSAVHVYGRGLALLSGNVGAYMIDLVRDAPAPSRTAMTDQANTVLGRLP